MRHFLSSHNFTFFSLHIFTVIAVTLLPMFTAVCCVYNICVCLCRRRVEISRLNGSFLLASWGSSTSSLYLFFIVSHTHTHTRCHSHECTTYLLTWAAVCTWKLWKLLLLEYIKGRKFPCELVAQIFSIFLRSSFFMPPSLLLFRVCLFSSSSSSNSKSFSCILCRRRRRRRSCFAVSRQNFFVQNSWDFVLFKKSRIENITRFYLIAEFSSDIHLTFFHIPRKKCT